MTLKEKRIFLIWCTIAMMVVATVSGFLGSGKTGRDMIVSSIRSKVDHKENLATKYIEILAHDLESGDFYGSYFESRIYGKLGENDISFLIYRDGSLEYWSDNRYDAPPFYDISLFGEPIVFLQNGWFIPVESEVSSNKIVSLIRLTTEYGFENDIVRSGFVPSLKVPENVEIDRTNRPEGYVVSDQNDEYLFSLVFPDRTPFNLLTYISLAIWMFSFLSVLLLIDGVAAEYSKKRKGFTGVMVSLISLISIYLALIFLRQPDHLNGIELFSPLVFSINGFVPSLGHLFVLGTIIFTACNIIYKQLSHYSYDEETGIKGEVTVTLLFFTGVLLLSFAHTVFKAILSESNINLEFYKVLDLDFTGIISYLSVLLLFISSFWMFLKGVGIACRLRTRMVILPILISFVVVLLFFYRDIFSLLSVGLFLLAQIVFVLIINRKETGTFNFSLIFALMISVYSLAVITLLSETKKDERIRIEALAFSIENDPEAELLMLDMWNDINTDSVLRNMMGVLQFNNEDYYNINNYLHDRYFSGYWENYNISIYLCDQGQPLRIVGDSNESEDCFGFFEERIDQLGHRITGTDFYFIENQAGRTYYLGKIFFDSRYGGTKGLFMEFFSDINLFLPGYSELLLDKDFHGYTGMSDYSFIKYIGGKTAVSYGEYDYKTSDAEYLSHLSEYNTFKEGGFKHILYKNGDTTVIISRSSLGPANLLISFAYIFIVVLLLFNLSIVFIRGMEFNRVVFSSLRQKFQIAIIGILLVSSVFVGFLVSNLTITRYRSNHYDNIKEKMLSVSMAIDYGFGGVDFERALENNTLLVDEILIDLSNVLNTDINFYDLDGLLIATSRPEIFNRDLLSVRMNNAALINLSEQGGAGFTHTEMVGNMKYISSYAPYYDLAGNIIAYINLPYFRMQSSFAKEISDMVVAVINVTLLLIIVTMGIAFIIVGRLTAPLSMLSRGLSSVKLGKKAEHIDYNDDDEIGDLIKQYNLMVDELDDSTVKLANSEREYAWREMAKQIAHEIKNPLTPMKLNVQQLHKSYKDNVLDFDERMNSFSKNQIEYIDNLSSIATAFSSFAKMPGNNPVKLDLVDQIKTTLELFRNSNNIVFKEEWPKEEKVYVYADREHMNGVFSNLFKNGIQAIPQDRKGIIHVSLKVLRDKTMVTVSDNGSGIPQEIRDKLFTPNFTTKSSGTGLGLSIVKKYVENCGGSIRFESQIDKGTTFFVDFPLMFTVEKP